MSFRPGLEALDAPPGRVGFSSVSAGKHVKEGGHRTAFIACYIPLAASPRRAFLFLTDMLIASSLLPKAFILRLGLL